MQFVLAEDDEVAAAGVSMALEAYGHHAVVVHDRKTLIAAIEAQQPDAIAMDIVLDGEDGITLSRAVRERWPQLPVIFATGRESYPGLPNALLDANTRYVQKPYAIAALVHAVRDIRRTKNAITEQRCKPTA